MKEVFSMWSNTRMVVLTAICAALYAALMLPFKIAPIIPGFSEIRPGVVIPLTCSLLFGPAAAWGAAIGNVIGDIWGGMVSPGSFFGFFGNFIMAYIPYRFWRLLTGKTEIEFKEIRHVLIFVLICIIASSACAIIVGWGLDILRFVPLKVLANVVAINNSIFMILLGIPLTSVLYRRVKGWGLIYADILKEDGAPAKTSRLGALIMVLGSIGGMIALNLGFKNPGFSVVVFVICIAAVLL